ncbi:hypothetical protein EVAR_61094_1 [Eumeta japonica]|uniref:Uncharacterized protein n=1 Tax=Eumeta variegata TaxID=151549 RepID=A0A4C1YQB2_EUMVA|nr:hypothetical protein EVAR_61094_1 [Eumeta japonica]
MNVNNIIKCTCCRSLWVRNSLRWRRWRPIGGQIGRFYDFAVKNFVPKTIRVSWKAQAGRGAVGARGAGRGRRPERGPSADARGRESALGDGKQTRPVLQINDCANIRAGLRPGSRDTPALSPIDIISMKLNDSHPYSCYTRTLHLGLDACSFVRNVQSEPRLFSRNASGPDLTPGLGALPGPADAAGRGRRHPPPSPVTGCERGRGEHSHEVLVDANDIFPVFGISSSNARATRCNFSVQLNLKSSQSLDATREQRTRKCSKERMPSRGGLWGARWTARVILLKVERYVETRSTRSRAAEARDRCAAPAPARAETRWPPPPRRRRPAHRSCRWCRTARITSTALLVFHGKNRRKHAIRGGRGRDRARAAAASRAALRCILAEERAARNEAALSQSNLVHYLIITRYHAIPERPEAPAAGLAPPDCAIIETKLRYCICGFDAPARDAAAGAFTQRSAHSEGGSHAVGNKIYFAFRRTSFEFLTRTPGRTARRGRAGEARR